MVSLGLIIFGITFLTGFLTGFLAGNVCSVMNSLGFGSGTINLANELLDIDRIAVRQINNFKLD